MATNDYEGSSDMHHLRRDVSDAHSNAQLAKWLAIIALVTAAIALGVAAAAMNKAGEAQSSANRNSEKVQQVAN